jgi:hypothetical protein
LVSTAKPHALLGDITFKNRLSLRHLDMDDLGSFVAIFIEDCGVNFDLQRS